MSRFYVWQLEFYETGKVDPVKPAEVMRYRPMPCTPAGDLVCQCPTGADAEKVVAALNEGTFAIWPLKLPGVNVTMADYLR